MKTDNLYAHALSIRNRGKMHIEHQTAQLQAKIKQFQEAPSIYTPPAEPPEGTYSKAWETPAQVSTWWTRFASAIHWRTGASNPLNRQITCRRCRVFMFSCSVDANGYFTNTGADKLSCRLNRLDTIDLPRIGAHAHATMLFGQHRKVVLCRLVIKHIKT